VGKRNDAPCHRHVGKKVAEVDLKEGTEEEVAEKKRKGRRSWKRGAWALRDKKKLLQREEGGAKESRG